MKINKKQLTRFIIRNTVAIAKLILCPGIHGFILRLKPHGYRDNGQGTHTYNSNAAMYVVNPSNACRVLKQIYIINTLAPL